MANPFKAIYNFLKGLFTRPGMQAFLQRYMDDAEKLIEDLATKHDNAGFYNWRDEAFELAKERYNEVRGTWITILLNFAYEAYLSRRAKQVR